MKTQPVMVFFAIIVIASLACSLGVPQVSRIETGATETFTLNEPPSNTDAVHDVNMTMALGELNLGGGAESLVEGAIRYNVAVWKPSVTRQDNSLTVAQGDRDDRLNGLPGEDIVNEWTVRLGDLPMNLSLQAGAYDGALDLSGLRLQRLDIQDGASSSEIRFDTLNPEEMQSLTYHTGASKITFLGLANANFTQMTFEGGAGEYVFDFSGDLQRDATVNIKVGLSDVRIVVPRGVSAQIMTEGAVGTVQVENAWKKQSEGYFNEGNGYRLTLLVELGAGRLYLSNE